jgi:hypothetical protein
MGKVHVWRLAIRHPFFTFFNGRNAHKQASVFFVHALFRTGSFSVEQTGVTPARQHHGSAVARDPEQRPHTAARDAP